jgi:hypothetical protein
VEPLDGYRPLLLFDTDAWDFVRGFEAGRIWTMMRTDYQTLVGQAFHAVSAEMVMRMIEACDVPLRAEYMPDNDTWMLFVPRS